MAARTVHVFPSDGNWLVKKVGKPGQSCATRRDAVDAARKRLKKDGSGQFVVYGKDGQIRKHEVYRLTPVQDPPGKSPRAGDIARAVGRLALEHVQSDSPRDSPSES